MFKTQLRPPQLSLRRAGSPNAAPKTATRWLRPALATLTTLMLGAAALAPTSPAQAGVFSKDPNGDVARPFYYNSATLDGTPGKLLRQEAAVSGINTLGISKIGPYKAQRILYSSKNRTGKNIAVSGIVIEPKRAWSGKGQRPIIAYAPGTQGISDDCAPSWNIANSIGDYEQLFFKSFLAKGYAVVVTDYEGLGTPGAHTYMDRVSQGHAVLDSARAATQLKGWDLSKNNPIVINGYSQGGGAAASAAELAGTYAPELNIKGAAAGAVPANLSALPAKLDGGKSALFELYALKGLTTSYGVTLPLSPHGQQVMQRATNTCVMGGSFYSGTRLSQLTSDGTDVNQLMAQEPYRTMLAEQRIGNLKPTMPVLLTHGRGDDVIDYQVGSTLASDWCARGARVTFTPNDAKSHTAGASEHLKQSLVFTMLVLDGLSPNSCSAR